MKLKMTKEIRAIMDQDTEICAQVVILGILSDRAVALGANLEIREMLALLQERYTALSAMLESQLDALAAAQEATHE